MKTLKNHSICALCLALALTHSAFAESGKAAKRIYALKDGDISQWNHQTFSGIEKTTSYQPVNIKGDKVLEATTSGGASLLYRRRTLELAKTPFFYFRWKVIENEAKADERKKSGDDFSMRVYVSEQTATGLNTLIMARANTLPKGAKWESPHSGFFNKVMMFAVGDAKTPLGEWQETRINLLKLWMKAFGRPPKNIDGVGIMTDGDATNSKMRAQYGDIYFYKRH